MALTVETPKGSLANWFPIDSYAHTHACSARNITWQHINHSGHLPPCYKKCPHATAILNYHGCAPDISSDSCKPSWFDGEFTRYAWGDWGGLGMPWKKDAKGKYQWRYSWWNINLIPGTMNWRYGWSHGPINDEADWKLAFSRNTTKYFDFEGCVREQNGQGLNGTSSLSRLDIDLFVRDGSLSANGARERDFVDVVVEHQEVTAGKSAVN